MKNIKNWILRFVLLIIIIGVLYVVYSSISPGQDVTKNTDKVGDNLPFLPKIDAKLTINSIQQNGNEYLIRYNGSQTITLTKGIPFPNNNSKNELIDVKYSSSINHSYMIRTVNTVGSSKWLNKNRPVLISYNYVIYIKQNSDQKGKVQNKTIK